MATIASLIIRIGADASNVRVALSRTQRDLATFARNASRLNTRDVFGNLPVNLNRNVNQAMRELNRLRTEFARRMTQIKTDNDNRSLFSSARAYRDGLAAQQAFDRGIRDAQRRFGSGSGQVAQRISAGLLSQLKDTSNPIHDVNQQLTLMGDIGIATGARLTRGLTLPLVAIGVAGVKAAGDFEKSFNRARAFIDDSAVSITQLKNAAINLAQVAPFGPKEIAEGMAILGQAGLKASQILGKDLTGSVGALRATLQLATIESVSLEEAATIATRTIAGFGGKVENAQEFIDKMVVASLSGTVNLVELGDAFKYAGSISKLAGQSFNDTLAILTQLAQGGLPASLGGTSIRQLTNNLLNPTPRAAKAMAELGKRINQSTIFVKDAKHEMLPLIAIFKQMADAGITASEAFTIFDRRAGQAGAILAQGGVIQALVDLSSKINHAGGEAERVSQTQFSGFNAELKKLGGTLVGLSVQLGDSGALRGLTNFVRGMRQLVSQIKDVNPATVTFVAKLLGFLAVLGPIISLAGKFTKLLGLARIAVLGLAGATGLGVLTTVLGPGSLIIAGLIAGAVALERWAEAAIKAANRTAQFESSLAGLSTDALEDKRLSTQAVVNDLKRQKAEFDKIVDQGRPDSHGVISQDFIEQSRAFDSAKQSAEELAGTIAIYEENLRVIRAALEATRKAQENKTAADEDAIKRARALSNQQGVADARASLISGITAQIEEMKGVTAEINRVSVATRGQEDRQERLAPSIEQAQTLWERVSKTINNIPIPKLRRQFVESATAMKKAMDAASVADPRAFRPLLVEADNLLARIDAVKDSTSNVVQQNELLRPLYAELLDLQTRISAEIAKQGGIYKANSGLVAKNNQLLRQLPPPDPIRTILPQFAAQLDNIIREFQQAKLAFDTAVAKGDEKLITATGIDLDAAQTRIREFATQLGDALRVLDSQQASPEDKIAAWDEFLNILQSVGAGLSKVSEKTLLALSVLSRVDAIFQSIGNFAADLGLGAVFQDALGSMNNLIAASQQLVEALAEAQRLGRKLKIFDALPGILGAVGTVFKFGAGDTAPFGIGDSSEKRQKADLIRALDDLRVAVDRSELGLGRQSEIASTILKLDFTKIQTAGTKFTGGSAEKSVEEVKRQLAGFGLTLTDVERMAKEFGLDIRDDSGKITVAGLLAVAEAAGLSAAALIKFTESIDNTARLTELKQRLTLGRSLTGTESLTAEFQTLVDSLGPAFQAMVAGIDITTQQGREQLRQAFLRIISMIESGAIDPAKAGEFFGKFKDADELFAWIDKVTAGMEGLDDAINASSQNIPTGFKLALAKFDAQLPERIGDLEIKPNIDPGSLDPQFGGLLDGLVTASAGNTDKMVAAIKAVEDAIAGATGGSVPKSDGITGAPKGDTASTAVLRSLDELKSVGNATVGATLSVKTAIEALAAVITEIRDSDNAGAIRGVQASIIRKQPIDFSADSDFSASVSRGGGGGPREVNFNFGDIKIQGADKTAREQWRDVKEIARDDARRRFGDPNKWGIVP